MTTVEETEYHLTFPLTPVLFDSNELTFSINHIKSRLTSVLYFRFKCYNQSKTLIHTYTSPRWVIDTVYKRRSRTFTIPQDIVDSTYYTQIELVAVGIDSENPLYFTECMLNEGDDIGYHTPKEHLELSVGFKNSRYVNLYNSDGTFLQVIRPQGDGITTNKLNKSTCTVLAPHFSNESNVDDPINIFLEFINQTEQRIDVLR